MQREWRTIWRVEQAETAKGMYCFFAAQGHPRLTTSHMPTPRADNLLKAAMEDFRSPEYPAGFDIEEMFPAMFMPTPKDGTEVMGWMLEKDFFFFKRMENPWKFGFPTKRVMRQWLGPRDWELAHGFGLVVSEYRVHKKACFCSPYQAVFHDGVARRVACHAI